MATQKKVYPKQQNGKTEVFVASWPSLTEEAEFKGAPNGKYEVKQTVEADSETLKGYKAFIKQATADGKKVYGSDWKPKFLPFVKHKEKNEAGEYVEDGRIDVIFRCHAYRKIDGEKTKVRLPIYDHYGARWDFEKEIWSGSKLQVAFKTNPYDSPMASGIQFQIAGVKVQEAVGPGERDASDLFDFDDAPATVEQTNPPEPDEDIDDDDIPF